MSPPPSGLPPADLPDPPEGWDPLAAERPYGLLELIGFEVTDWAAGRARVELTLGPQHGNRYGLPHGGVHAAMMDTAAGYAGSWCPWPGRVRRAMTLSMSLTYLGQVRGARLIAEAQVTGGGRKTYFAAAALRDELGTEIASGLFTMRWRGAGGAPEGDPLDG